MNHTQYFSEQLKREQKLAEKVRRLQMLFGGLLGGVTMGWWLYEDWKTAIAVFLLIWANNLCRGGTR